MHIQNCITCTYHERFPYTHADQEDFDTTTSATSSQHSHDDQEYPQSDQGPCQTTDHAGHRWDVLKGFQHRGYEVRSHDNQRPGGDQRQSNELKKVEMSVDKEFIELKGMPFFLFRRQDNQ